MTGDSPRRGACVVAIATLMAFLQACGPSIRSTAPGRPTPQFAAELWVEPADPAERDLFYGFGGAKRAPDPDAVYEFAAKDPRGFSTTYDVVDPSGVEWSVKIGPESQTEVVGSRLLWAVGYHQPPTYYLPRWKITGGETGDQPAGRFRPKVEGLRRVGIWSWQRNPFVGTRPYRGLLVLLLMMNSSDLKNDNNTVYESETEMDGARRWYVVRDLGASFGKTGRLYPRRNDLDAFEEAGFITGIENGRVRFDYQGLHQALFRDLTVADVRWAAERLDRLTPKQWNDAFRAGGYREDETARYIRKLREKIEQAQKLDERVSDGGSRRRQGQPLSAPGADTVHRDRPER